MSVLDAFIHDPLVEWEDETRKRQREHRHAKDKDKYSAAIQAADLRLWAKSAVRPIERKLEGLYSPTNVKERTYGGVTRGGEDEREISTSNLVQMLIQEAIDPANLVRCILDGLRGTRDYTPHSWQRSRIIVLIEIAFKSTRSHRVARLFTLTQVSRPQYWIGDTSCRVYGESR